MADDGGPDSSDDPSFNQPTSLVTFNKGPPVHVLRFARLSGGLLTTKIVARTGNVAENRRFRHDFCPSLHKRDSAPNNQAILKSGT